MCAAQRGVEHAARGEDGVIGFRADGEHAVGELSLALTEARALSLELAPRMASLEDLFFDLTEGADAREADAARIAEAASLVEDGQA